MKDDWWTNACRMLAAARSPEDVSELLDLLLTPSERRAIAERCAILKLLQKGYTQRHVRDTAKTSIATVSRGACVLSQHGSVLKKHLARMR
jgi:Trp operon repressor